MTAIIYYLLLTFITFVIGIPFLYLIKSFNFKYKYLLSSVLGYSFINLAVTLLYINNFLMKHIIYILLALAAIILFLFFILKLINKPFEKNDFKTGLLFLSFWFFISIIIIAPYFIGGNQFSVFQGNQWDTFGYLNSSVVYSKLNYTDVISKTAVDIINNPLLTYAKSNMHLRPSVHLLYSFSGYLFQGNYHSLYYIFLAFFFVQSVLVISFLLINFFNCKSLLISFLISSAFSFGFWGQYIFDINAWSQISSIPINILEIGFVIFLLKQQQVTNKNDYLKILILLTFLFSSFIYLYPESFFFQLPALFFICLIVLIYNFLKKKNILNVFVIGFAFILSILTALLFYKGTIKFLFGQVGVTAAKPDMYRYFQAFFLGRDGFNASFFDTIVDFFSSLTGLYFLTPDFNFLILNFLCRIFLLIIMSSIFYLLFKFFIPKKILINNKLKVFFFLFLFILISFISVLYNFLYKTGIKKIGSKVAIEIKGLNSKDFSDIDVFRISPKNIPDLLEKQNNIYQSDDVYFKNIELHIPDKNLNDINNIKIIIGSENYIISMIDLKKYWYKNELSNNKLVFISPPEIQDKRSKIPLFRSIINWQGDKEIFVSSISALEFLKIFLAIFIIFVLPYLFRILENKKIVVINIIDKNNFLLKIFTVFFVLLFLTDLIMLIRRDLWGAGKGFSFISPFFIIFISLPLLNINFNKRTFFNPIFIFLILQFSFGFYRIYSSSNQCGIHYNNPYPSIQWDSIKKEINWNVDSIKKFLSKEDVLQLSVNDRFLENYLVLYSYENNIRYFKTTPVYEYFGNGENYGYQKQITGNTKILTLNNNILKVISKNSRGKNINSTLILKENSFVTADFYKGWDPLISDDHKSYYMDSQQAYIMINNFSSDLKRINLTLEFTPINPENNISIFLNNKQIIDFVNHGKYFFHDLKLIKGENKLYFYTKLPPRILNYQKFIKKNYAFSSIIIEELD